MHLPSTAPVAWRTGSVGVGRNEVEAEWGSTGGGHSAPNCSQHSTRSTCPTGHTRSQRGELAANLNRAAVKHSLVCEWDDMAKACVDRFSVTTALTYAADLIGGYWYSTQAPGQGVSWSVAAKAVANATCVNAHVNAVVDRAGAAACREARTCPGSSSAYPLDGASVEERNCWVECFVASVLGRRMYPSSVSWAGAGPEGVPSAALVAAFEAGFASAECQL